MANKANGRSGKAATFRLGDFMDSDGQQPGSTVGGAKREGQWTLRRGTGRAMRCGARAR